MGSPSSGPLLWMYATSLGSAAPREIVVGPALQTIYAWAFLSFQASLLPCEVFLLLDILYFFFSFNVLSFLSSCFNNLIYISHFLK